MEQISLMDEPLDFLRGTLKIKKRQQKDDGAKRASKLGFAASLSS